MFFCKENNWSVDNRLPFDMLRHHGNLLLIYCGIVVYKTSVKGTTQQIVSKVGARKRFESSMKNRCKSKTTMLEFSRVDINQAYLSPTKMSIQER